MDACGALSCKSKENGRVQVEGFVLDSSQQILLLDHKTVFQKSVHPENSFMPFYVEPLEDGKSPPLPLPPANIFLLLFKETRDQANQFSQFSIQHQLSQPSERSTRPRSSHKNLGGNNMISRPNSVCAETTGSGPAGH